MEKNEVPRNYQKELVSAIRRLGQIHSISRVFEDFLAISAVSVSNAVNFRDDREQEYLSIVKRYSKEELNVFTQMFADLVLALDEHANRPCDVLGPVFHELELHDQYKGQFFTPQHVSDMMAQIAIGEDKPEVSKYGYFTVSDCACGSGVMLLSVARATEENKHSFQKEMLAFGTDIDLKCVHMTYLQLSLYGIPAVVVHGNSITMEEWSQWYTPIYLLEGWATKEHFRFFQENSEKTTETDILETSAPHVDLYQYGEQKSGQFSLFQEEELER